MRDDFPFHELTPNEMSFEERDRAYADLHNRDETVYLHSSGLQMVWKYADVEKVLRADVDGITNDNSLDPLEGYPKLVGNPRGLAIFCQHLLPPPAKATANAPSGELHNKVSDALVGPDGHFTIKQPDKDRRVESMRGHFNKAFDAALGQTAIKGSLDITSLSAAYAAALTGEAVGIDPDDWPRIVEWSGAQSGLLGQYMPKDERNIALEGLGQLFTVSKEIVRRRKKEPDSDLASRLLGDRITAHPATAVMANSLAAGVHTIAGTIQQGVERLLSDHDRIWWSRLDDQRGAQKVTDRILQLDPGLVAWKRRATKRVRLESGAVLERGGILAMFAAANRDPTVFPDPYNLDRRQGEKVLTFGIGEHECVGKQLARLGISVFLQELYQNAPNATLIDMASAADNRKRDLLFSGADVRIRV